MNFKVFIFYASAFLAVMAIVSLAILYSGSVVTPDGKGPLADNYIAAKVGGVEITGREINQAIDSVGENTPDEGQAELKRRQQEALEMLIQLQVLKNEAFTRNINIGEEQYSQRLDQYLAQGRDAFESLLADNNLTEEQFRERLREDMLIEQLVMQVRKELIEQMVITDDEITTFYQKNLQRYDVSEIAHIYIRIQPPGEEKQIETAREKANDVIARLRRGSSFRQLAKQFSDDTATKNSGGVLGPLNSGLLSNNAINAVSALEAGAFTTEPLQIQEGFQILKRLNKQYQPLGEVKENIRQQLVQIRIEKSFEKWLAETRSKADVQIYLKP